ncbi:MAG TPA: lipopolysaccharide assembly protein LapA domain-containing protein [Gaiellales bacterium]|nr:lipopolysaccharide assembly protein LapA domain-containing protein [Gaiellales bacterium]
MTSSPQEPVDPVQPAQAEAKDPLRSSKVSRFWAALAALVLLLVLLVVFVAQNTDRVSVAFLGWDWHPPLAVALLIAAAAGLAISVAAGTLRIWQLHRRVRRTD